MKITFVPSEYYTKCMKEYEKEFADIKKKLDNKFITKHERNFLENLLIDRECEQRDFIHKAHARYECEQLKQMLRITPKDSIERLEIEDLLISAQIVLNDLIERELTNG